MPQNSRAQSLLELAGECPAIEALREKVADFLRRPAGATRQPSVLIQGATGTERFLGQLCRDYERQGEQVVGISSSSRFEDTDHLIPGCSAVSDALTSASCTPERTAERRVTTDGARNGKVAIQTNSVEADERGLVYLADRGVPGLLAGEKLPDGIADSLDGAAFAQKIGQVSHPLA